MYVIFRLSSGNTKITHAKHTIYVALHLTPPPALAVSYLIVGRTSENLLPILAEVVLLPLPLLAHPPPPKQAHVSIVGSRPARRVLHDRAANGRAAPTPIPNPNFGIAFPGLHETQSLDLDERTADSVIRGLRPCRSDAASRALYRAIAQ